MVANEQDRSRQGPASTLVTGDEREPQLPNVTENDHSEFGHADVRPPSGIVTSEPEVMEDADTYVRRMM